MPGGVDLASRRRHECRQQVGQVHDLPRADARRNPARPDGEGRDADSPFPERPLLAPERPIAVQGRTRTLVAALESRSMVACKDNERLT